VKTTSTQNAYSIDAPVHPARRWGETPHQAELHSADADFARFPGLRRVNPFA
jgi:hypothetical protein